MRKAHARFLSDTTHCPMVTSKSVCRTTVSTFAGYIDCSLLRLTFSRHWRLYWQRLTLLLVTCWEHRRNGWHCCWWRAANIDGTADIHMSCSYCKNMGCFHFYKWYVRSIKCTSPFVTKLSQVIISMKRKKCTVLYTATVKASIAVEKELITSRPQWGSFG